jgi:hypothetical protein
MRGSPGFLAGHLQNLAPWPILRSGGLPGLLVSHLPTAGPANSF